MNKTIKNKLRSKALWAAIFALIIFVSKNYLNYEIPKVNELVDLLLLIMTLIGIIKNH
jgi:uncharacterized membrane protein